MAKKFYAVHTLIVGAGERRKRYAPGTDMTELLDADICEGMCVSGSMRSEEVKSPDAAPPPVKKSRKPRAKKVDSE